MAKNFLMNFKNTKWVLLLVLSLIWGSSFLLIKKGLIGLSPMQLGSLRIVFGALFLIAIGFKTLPSISKKQWRYLLLTAFFGTFAPAYLFALAETEIDSSVSSILNSLTPLNALLLGVLGFGVLINRNQILGVFVGLIGSLILILNGAANHPNQNYYYAILVLIAAFCYGLNVNLVKKYLFDMKPLAISTGNFTVMLPPALLILISTGFFETTLTVATEHSLFFIMILGVFGTGIANLIFFKLIQISSPVFATSVTYLIPIVAFFWGMLDHESLSLMQLFGAFVILIGVYLSAKK